MYDEILSSIDNIDDCVMEAEMNVLTAMCNEYDKAIMIMENYNGNSYDCFDIFQESVIMEDGEQPKKENIIKRFIKWIKNMTNLIFDKIKGLWNKFRGKNKEVETSVDVKGLSELTNNVVNNEDKFTVDMRNKLSELKQNKTKMSFDEAGEIIEKDMKKINDKIKEIERELNRYDPKFTSKPIPETDQSKADKDQLRKQCQDLTLLLNEYKTLIKEMIETIPHGDQNIINKLTEALKNATTQPVKGSKSISAYPYLYTKTLKHDYHTAILPEPLKQNKQLYFRAIRNKSGIYSQSDGRIIPNVYYINGYYLCIISVNAWRLAELCSYKIDDEFEVIGSSPTPYNVKKYFQDVVRRNIWGMIGYLIPENMIDEDNIPIFNINDLFEIYLYYQEQYWKTPAYVDLDTKFGTIISKQTAKLQIK